MRRLATVLLGLTAAMLAGSAYAEDTIKIGLIEPYSGQFADGATQQDNAVTLFMKQNGDTIAGKKIEIIRKGQHATVYVTVAERPTEEQLAKIAGGGSETQGAGGTAPTAPQRALGLSLAPLTPDAARSANDASVR